MQAKRTGEVRARKARAGGLKSRATERKEKSEDRIFAQDAESLTDLAKTTGGGELTVEASARLIERNQDRARGRGKERNPAYGEDKAAEAAYRSGAKVFADNIARRSKRGAE